MLILEKMKKDDNNSKDLDPCKYINKGISTFWGMIRSKDSYGQPVSFNY